jgi:hypothetical protein
MCIDMYRREGGTVSERVRTLILSLACNDERGNFQGFAEKISLHDEALEISSRLWNGGCACKFLEGNKVKIGRVTVEQFGHKTWYGNWCWDAVAVTPEAAAKILNQFAGKENWFCESGWCELADKWDAKIPLTAEDFKEIAR